MAALVQGVNSQGTIKPPDTALFAHVRHSGNSVEFPLVPYVDRDVVYVCGAYRVASATTPQLHVHFCSVYP